MRQPSLDKGTLSWVWTTVSTFEWQRLRGIEPIDHMSTDLVGLYIRKTQLLCALQPNRYKYRPTDSGNQLILFYF